MRLDHNGRPLFFAVDNSKNAEFARRGTWSVLRRRKAESENHIGAYAVVEVFGRNCRSDAEAIAQVMNEGTHQFDEPPIYPDSSVSP